MAKIRYMATTNKFHGVSVESGEFNESKDCTVKAVALVCGVPYAEAHATLAKLGRKPRDGATTYVTNNAIKTFGKVLTPVDMQLFIMTNYRGNHRGLKHLTTHHPARFPKVWKDGCTYVAYTAGHALAIVDGVVHDWSAGKAMHLTNLYRVTDAPGHVSWNQTHPPVA